MQTVQALSDFVMAPAITVNSRWRRKQVFIEVIITRVSFRTVSYIAVDCSVSGTLPQWLFLQDFQPVSKRKKKGHANR